VKKKRGTTPRCVGAGEFWVLPGSRLEGGTVHTAGSDMVVETATMELCACIRIFEKQLQTILNFGNRF